MIPVRNLTEKVANSICFANGRWKKGRGHSRFLVIEEARAAINAVREWDERSNYELLNEMEMRSAHASFCDGVVRQKKNIWFNWSFQRYNYQPILTCLKLLYSYEKAKAEDLYECC